MKHRDLAFFTHRELSQYTHNDLAKMRLYITDRAEGDVLKITKKGTLCADDLNRMEDNTLYINSRLAAEGHGVSVPSKIDWVRTDWPTQTELERIVQNVRRLRDNFCQTNRMPELPESMLNPHYSGINAIEQTQRELDNMTDRLIEGYRYSGTFFCGEEVI